MRDIGLLRTRILLDGLYARHYHELVMSMGWGVCGSINGDLEIYMRAAIDPLDPSGRKATREVVGVMLLWDVATYGFAGKQWHGDGIGNGGPGFSSVDLALDFCTCAGWEINIRTQAFCTQSGARCYSWRPVVCRRMSVWGIKRGRQGSGARQEWPHTASETHCDVMYRDGSSCQRHTRTCLAGLYSPRTIGGSA